MDARCYVNTAQWSELVPTAALETTFVEMLETLMSSIHAASHSWSLYDGVAGYVYLYYHLTGLASSLELPRAFQEGMDIYCRDACYTTLTRLKTHDHYPMYHQHDESFYFGSAGVLLVMFIYARNRLNLKMHVLHPLWIQFQHICTDILASSTDPHKTTTSSSSSSSTLDGARGRTTSHTPSSHEPLRNCNGVLYGRAGLLLGLHWFSIELHSTNRHEDKCLEEQLGQELEEIQLGLVQQLVEQGVHRGEARTTIDEQSCRLVYCWHDQEYVGAAHGVAGILHALLKYWSYLTESQQCRVKRTLDWMISLGDVNEHGNFASTYSSTGGWRDVSSCSSYVAQRHKQRYLVHWCHGAPGIIPVLVEAARVYEADRLGYLWLAQDLARKVVWTYGLLSTKGWGLCHGVGGNGYAFLDVYHASGEKKYLNMARHFAHWFSSEEAKETQFQPDRPFGLFTGLGGAIVYLSDVLVESLEGRGHFPFY